MEHLKETAWKVAGELRGRIHEREQGYVTMVALCHAKLITLEKRDELLAADGDFVRVLVEAVKKSDSSAHIAHFVERTFNDMNKSDGIVVKNIYEQLPNEADELASIILDLDFEEELSGRYMLSETATPGSVTELALKILDINDEERVADFGTGTGTFLVKAAKSADCELVYGCERNTVAASIAMMRAEVLGSNVIVEQADLFHIDGAFNKCFSNYPFNLKYKEDALQCLAQQGFDGLPRFQSSDWLFSLELIARLREGGKAVGVMMRGGLFNGADERIRRHFIANGWIEAVIALPAGIFSPYTNALTTLLVLSKGNESVRLVDASELCQKGRRKTTFSEDDIAEIMRLLESDDEGLSCTKTYEEFEAERFNLNPERHLSSAPVIENGASLESLAVRITRGSGWSKKQLEEFNSNKPTKFRYLMLQNIVDGELEEELPYLTEIDSSQDRYCVSSGDLLLSKIGPNFKVAVADIPDGEKVLATGNLYIIQVDTGKIDPRYVKLYLETDEGIMQLRRACVGTTMPSIPMNGFADIMIPMISLDEQAALIEKYEALREEIVLHRMAIERAQQKMATLLDAK